MLQCWIHDPIALARPCLQLLSVQDVQLASRDFDQAVLAEFSSGQGDRFTAHAQNVCNFLVCDLQDMPLGLVQCVHEPANDLLLVAVFAAAKPSLHNPTPGID